MDVIFRHLNQSNILQFPMKIRLIKGDQIIKNLFLLACLISFLSQPVYSQNGLTTIILVRHAEKMDNSSDPGLSETGYKRADKLAAMFRNVEFDAVYTTDFKRTRETARPVAEANNLTISIYNYRDLPKEAKSLLEAHKGETILVSGHSNTTPAFANEILGYEHFEENFNESDYGNLLLIIISSGGEKKLLHLRY